ncbi:MAG: hypothetical protein KJ950_14680 [Proteobacteria bacterium]|nr:hypothetical protein [Pseudomonadota bacterium]MBU1689014.1 hypothetical protein [Pseudomonadota bacterium]
MNNSGKIISLLALFLLVTTLSGCGGGGSSSTNPTPDNGTTTPDNGNPGGSTDTNGSTDPTPADPEPTTTPPVYSGFNFSLSEGDFWEFSWDYYYQSYAQGSGTKTKNDSGKFWVVLGTPKTINGITAYAVDIYGDSSVTGETDDFAPRWTFLALADNVLLGSTNGLTLQTIFDAQAGKWAGGGFFTSISSDTLVTAGSGTINNDYLNQSAIKTGRSSSQSQCEYFPGVGNICGDESYNYTENEYFLGGIGPLGYYYYNTASYSGGGFYSSYQWKHNVGLTASSFNGDALPSGLLQPINGGETEPNDTITQAMPITYGSVITGQINVTDPGSTNDAITDYLFGLGDTEVRPLQDWYSITTIGLDPEVIEIQVDFSQHSGATDLDIFLLGDNGTHFWVASISDNEKDAKYSEAVTLTLTGFTTPTTYHLGIMAYSTPQPTTYTLTLQNQ